MADYRFASALVANGTADAVSIAGVGEQEAQRYMNADGIVEVLLDDHAPLALQVIDTFASAGAGAKVLLGRDVMFRFDVTSTKARNGDVTLVLRDRPGGHTPLRERAGMAVAPRTGIFAAR